MKERRDKVRRAIRNRLMIARIIDKWATDICDKNNGVRIITVTEDVGKGD